MYFLHLSLVVVPPKCMDIKLNLAIILETSSEIGLQHFLAAKEFIKKLLELNDVSPTGTHVSLVLFNNRVYDVISFQQPSSQNRDTLSVILQFLPPQLAISPGKRLDIALTHVNDNVFYAVTSQRQDVTDVAVFITDGRIIDGNNITGTVSSLKVRLWRTVDYYLIRNRRRIKTAANTIKKLFTKLRIKSYKSS